MSDTENTWPAEAFDAVSLRLAGGDCTIAGSDDDQVRLEGNIRNRLRQSGGLEPQGKWLLLHLAEGMGDDTPATLYLSKKKAWVVRVLCSHGDVDVSDVQARLHVRVGAGDVHIRACRGVLAATTGAGDVSIEDWREAAMPEPPPWPQVEPERHAWPGWPGHNSEEHGDWMAWGPQEWAARAQEFAAQGRRWRERAGRVFGRMAEGRQPAGVSVHVGAGDIELHSVETAMCRLKAGQGDLTVEGGRIGGLHAHNGSGDVECSAVLPGGDWDIWTAHGDITLSLPANARVRLDAATRHGDIRSDVPLVRVARPGPEARYGGRMVGALGAAEGEAPQVSLAAMKGDITIELGERVEGEPMPPSAADERDMPVAAEEPRSATATEAGAGAAEPPPVYESQLAVLNALSEKAVTPEEAERLLRGMGL